MNSSAPSRSRSASETARQTSWQSGSGAVPAVPPPHRMSRAYGVSYGYPALGRRQAVLPIVAGNDDADSVGGPGRTAARRVIGSLNEPAAVSCNCIEVDCRFADIPVVVVTCENEVFPVGRPRVGPQDVEDAARLFLVDLA